MRAEFLVIVLQLFVYQVAAAKQNADNWTKALESPNETNNAATRLSENNKNNPNNALGEKKSSNSGAKTNGENNASNTSKALEEQKSANSGATTNGENNGNNTNNALKEEITNSGMTINGENNENSPTNPLEEQKTTNSGTTTNGEKNGSNTSSALKEKITYSGTTANGDNNANSSANTPKEERNINSGTTTDDTSTTTSGTDTTAPVVNKTDSTANPTNASSNNTTVKTAEKGLETSAFVTNETTPVKLQTPDAGNSTKVHEHDSLVPKDQTDLTTTASPANAPLVNTTQVAFWENTTSATQDTSEHFNFKKGINISARVFFYYDLDYEMEAYLRDQGDLKDVQNYLRTLLNGAELRFEPLENGSVTLIFAGSKLLSSHEIGDIRVLQGESLTVSTLYHFQRYILYHPPRFNADIYVYISNRTMISEYDDTDSSVGYAYQSGACTANNVAVVRDNAAAYTGSSSLAQNIALLLGATWDVNRTETGCMKEDGYLLSTYNASGRHYNMSICSQRDMLANISNKRKTTPSCLNQTETKPQSKKLPSEMFQSREYCRGYYRKDPFMQDCSKEQKLAAHLGECRWCCSNTTLLYQPVIDTVAPDGTKCGNKQICISGECVMDPRT